MFDIHAHMRRLAEHRPVFRSKQDFQDTLASLIRNSKEGQVVQVKHTLGSAGSKSIDVYVASDGVVIELVRRTERLDVVFDGTRYDLKSHSARDHGRHDFVKAIARLENAVSTNPFIEKGFSVILTNDPGYWDDPAPGWRDTYDADFRIHQGSVLSGSLAWHPDASEGTTRGETMPIELQSRYNMRWRGYSDLRAGRYSRFRYLAVEVGG